MIWLELEVKDNFMADTFRPRDVVRIMEQMFYDHNWFWSGIDTYLPGFRLRVKNWSLCVGQWGTAIVVAVRLSERKEFAAVIGDN